MERQPAPLGVEVTSQHDDFLLAAEYDFEVVPPLEITAVVTWLKPNGEVVEVAVRGVAGTVRQRDPTKDETVRAEAYWAALET